MPPRTAADTEVRRLGLELIGDVAQLADRYEIAEHGEQYHGFKALPSGIGLPASGMTSGDAKALLAGLVGPEYDDLPWPTVVKRARKVAHPDLNDGDKTLWDQVEKAIDTLSRGGRS